VVVIMKRFLSTLSLLILSILCLSGCSGIGNEKASLSIVYASAAVISMILLIAYICIVPKKNFWYIILFSSVFVVNIGYTILAVSANLEMALWANRISYLGSVFLPLAMLMIIVNVTNTPYKNILPKILFAIAFVIFLIAASPGILPIYYKEVSFKVVNGVSTLVKLYGPLHPLYLIYLVGYFVSMVTVIVRAQIKKIIDTTSHAVILAIAVFVNIGVWFIEQISDIDFEFLSVSYIISELFLLGVHHIMTENQRLRNIVKQVETLNTAGEDDINSVDTMLTQPIATEGFSPERIEIFIKGIDMLTPTERAVYDAYIARVTTKEIMANLNIKESTLKYHNRNIYGKLGVSTRKELLELHKHINSVKAKLDVMDVSNG